MLPNAPEDDSHPYDPQASLAPPPPPELRRLGHKRPWWQWNLISLFIALFTLVWLRELLALSFAATWSLSLVVIVVWAVGPAPRIRDAVLFYGGVTGVIYAVVRSVLTYGVGPGSWRIDVQTAMLVTIIWTCMIFAVRAKRDRPEAN